jgi:hypothetical protein
VGVGFRRRARAITKFSIKVELLEDKATGINTYSDYYNIDLDQAILLASDRIKFLVGLEGK